MPEHQLFCSSSKNGESDVWTENTSLEPTNFKEKKRRNRVRREEESIPPLLGATEKENTSLAYTAHPKSALGMRLEEHDMLVSEIAFALFISLAGLTRVRNSPFDNCIFDSDDESDNNCDTACYQNMSDPFEFSTPSNPDSLTFLTQPKECVQMNFNPEPPKPKSGFLLPPALLSAPSPFGRRTFVFGRDDTLKRVAEQYYHDTELAALIADLNRGAVKEEKYDGRRVVRVRLGQEVILPSWKDVDLFYSFRISHKTQRDVVTIVEEANRSETTGLYSQFQGIVLPL